MGNHNDMNPITVSTLSEHIANIIKQDEMLRDIWVIGEVSNWKRATSGHIYFSLKDQGANISALMWRNQADSHSWLPRSGDQIMAHGYVATYPDRGIYQLYVNRIQPAGRGELYAQFEKLKNQLQEQGYLDTAQKKPIVQAPQRVGIVTSPTAAALRDIVQVLSARWPLVEVVIFPTLVQGNEAPQQIEGAIASANLYTLHQAPLDTLIIARGGGSIEDLWAFNDSRVAYAIVYSILPVVTGIGHETDFTIADFVADLRMPTPSAAAAAVVPDQADIRERLLATRLHLVQQATRKLTETGQRFGQLKQRLSQSHPYRQLDQNRQQLDERTHRLQTAIHRLMAQQNERNRTAQLRLEALSPLNVLQRGYSIVQQQTGRVVTQPDQISPGELLHVRAAHGEYQVKYQTEYESDSVRD